MRCGFVITSIHLSAALIFAAILSSCFEPKSVDYYNQPVSIVSEDADVAFTSIQSHVLKLDYGRSILNCVGLKFESDRDLSIAKSDIKLVDESGSEIPVKVARYNITGRRKHAKFNIRKGDNEIRFHFKFKKDDKRSGKTAYVRIPDGNGGSAAPR